MKLKLMIGAAAAAVLLSACGSHDTVVETPPAETPPPAEVTPPPEATLPPAPVAAPVAAFEDSLSV